MAMEETPTVTATGPSFAKWSSWLAALVGLWVLASPFVLTGSIATGTAFWSTVGAGILVVVLATFGAYATRTAVESDPNSAAEVSSWVAAIVGVWIAASPFVLTGAISDGTAMWSHLGAGLIVLILGGYAGYRIDTGA